MFSSDLSGAAPPSWYAAVTILRGGWVNGLVVGAMATADCRDMILENRLAAAALSCPRSYFHPIPTVRNWKVKVDSGHYKRKVFLAQKVIFVNELFVSVHDMLDTVDTTIGGEEHIQHQYR